MSHEIPPELYCTKCLHVMYPPEHTPMKLDPCQHTVCEHCLLHYDLQFCPICSREIISFVRDEQTISDYKYIFDNKPKPNPNEVCNIIKYSTNLLNQNMYQCMTCQFHKDQFICPTCAQICHRGHVLVRFPKGFSSGCSCGYNQLKCACKCLSSDHRVPICTLSLKKLVTIQHAYSCKTCNLSVVCNACAEKCHRNHTLDDIGITEELCQCGLQKGLCPCRCYHPESVQNMTVISPTLPKNQQQTSSQSTDQTIVTYPTLEGII